MAPPSAAQRELANQLALAIAQNQLLALRAAKLKENLKVQKNVTRLAGRRLGC